MNDAHIRELFLKAQKSFENTDAKNPINHDLIKNSLKKRNKDIHKGNCGHLAICAASPGLTGAACMASEAALRGGCGLVTLCCAKELNSIFETKLTEAMTMPVKSKRGVISEKAFKDIYEKLKKCDALLYGPGLSPSKSIGLLLEKILSESNLPIVIDADGLNVLSQNMGLLKRAKSSIILTPHIGEFSRLTGLSAKQIFENKKEIALNFAKEYGVILVLKSHETIVTDGKDIFENVLGNPGMAVGGSGDVLAGLISAFLAQGNSILLSALAGVYIHSLAGDMAALEIGELSLLPRDIINAVPYAIKYSMEQ